jgi:hypothetical protein
MANVSAARQEQILLLGVAALLLTAAALFAIGGETRWPHWFNLSSVLLLLAVSGYVRRSPKPAKFIVYSLLVASVALSVTGVIGMLAARH